MVLFELLCKPRKSNWQKKMFAMLIRKLILPNIMFDDCWCNNQFIKHYYIRQMPLGGYYYRIPFTLNAIHLHSKVGGLAIYHIGCLATHPTSINKSTVQLLTSTLLERNSYEETFG